MSTISGLTAIWEECVHDTHCFWDYHCAFATADDVDWDSDFRLNQAAEAFEKADQRLYGALLVMAFDDPMQLVAQTLWKMVQAGADDCAHLIAERGKRDAA